MGDSTGIQVNDNPSSGAERFNSDSVTVSDTYYDADGNVIDPTGGFFVISSLNNNVGRDFASRESVKGSGVTPMAVIGSSITVHGDSLYSDFDNTDGKVNADGSYTKGPGTNPTSNNWDKTDSPYFYFGSGVMKINNSKPSLTFYSVPESNNSAYAMWFTISTVMPQVPIQKKTTKTNYHYDVS